MDTSQIAALLEPFLEQPLSASQLQNISIYIDLLLRWNARINLTAIRQEEEIVTRHFGESFFLARHLFPLASPFHPESSGAGSEAVSAAQKELYPSFISAPPRVLDIGSGAGFPALPLKLWAPHIQLTLIESNHKKAAFLREAARLLTLTNINVIADRVETMAANPTIPRADIVTLRAVERFENILPQAIKLMAAEGRLALLISTSQLPHLAHYQMRWDPPIQIPTTTKRVVSIGISRNIP